MQQYEEVGELSTNKWILRSAYFKLTEGYIAQW